MNNSSDNNLVLKKIKDVLSDDNFGYATAVITYCETKSLILNYVGMAEFRDALTHIQRAVNTTDSEVISSELNSAHEHIRRAAVESMQDYVERRYYILRQRIRNPYLYLFRVAYTLDWKKLNKSDEIIKNNILCGREAKPKKEWQEAIGFFFKAEEEIEKIDAIIPPMDFIKQRSNFVILGVLVLLLFSLVFTRVLG